MDRMVLAVVMVRHHPVILIILSAFRSQHPVLDPGSWAVERRGQRRGPATGSARIATRRVGWRPFAGPSSSIKISGTPARLSPASRAWPVPDVIAISVWIFVMSGRERVSEGSGVIGGRW